jgi:K+-transporting ATPase ATPase B chain
MALVERVDPEERHGELGAAMGTGAPGDHYPGESTTGYKRIGRVSPLPIASDSDTCLTEQAVPGHLSDDTAHAVRINRGIAVLNAQVSDGPLDAIWREIVDDGVSASSNPEGTGSAEPGLAIEKTDSRQSSRSSVTAANVDKKGRARKAPPTVHDRRIIYREAVLSSLRKLNPAHLFGNPVILSVEIGSIITTFVWLETLFGQSSESSFFVGSVALWLWFTVIFANFSEALAEGRGKAQAEALRAMRTETMARVLTSGARMTRGLRPAASDLESVSSARLAKGQQFFVEKGDIVPADGDVVEGAALVDESAITGESAPVVREAGGDRSAVTGGTRILSDWLVVQASADPGEGFLDQMISLIEGAKRKKTPNEIALNILLLGLTAVFLFICATLLPMSMFSVAAAGEGAVVTVTVLIALYVCLAPTTISGLLSAIGIAGMDRLISKNVIAFSGQAIEAAGDVDVLLLDKTGTITLGNRQAIELTPIDGAKKEELAEAAQLASLADETPEGRSIIGLVRERFDLHTPPVEEEGEKGHMTVIPFSAQTRMSGLDLEGVRYRKGAPDIIFRKIQEAGHIVSDELRTGVDRIARSGGTPLVVTRNEVPLGIIHLKDIVKGGTKERFSQLRKMGIKTVMITGDNKLTAGTIAAEAGVDDFLAEATPENKLAMIRAQQAEGRMVAMTGDGTNDAPALAQADVAVAMNTGTQPAREAANMIDLDSNPTKLIEIVETGKQLLMTRGSLTTFSITNDVAKYFAIIPAAFAATYPVLGRLNVMGLHDAILSAVIFNAIIIVLLIPLALRGVRYKPRTAAQALRNNLIIYGLGGIVAPFIGIKLIDILLGLLGV